MESTGIEALDKILGGGIPRPSANIIMGSMGSGKSVLVKELAINALNKGQAVCIYTLDTSSEDFRNEMKATNFDTEKYEKDELLYFVDVFSKGVKRVEGAYKNEEPGTSVLQSGLQFSDLVELGREFTLKNLKRKILEMHIMDSVTPLFIMSEPRAVFHYCQTLKYATRFSNAIGIAVHHSGVLDEKVENAFYGFADGIIKLERMGDVSSESVSGSISVLRMKDQNFLKGNYYYEITNRRINISTVAGIV